MRFRILFIFLLFCGLSKAQNQPFYPSRSSSPNADSLYKAAMHAMANTEYKKFFNHIEKTIAEDSLCFKAYAHAALLSYRLTNDKAIFDTLSKSAMKIAPRDWSEAAYSDVLKQTKVGNNAEIAIVLEKLVKQKPAVEGYFILGNHYSESGDLEAAHLNYYRAFRLDENFAPVYRMLSESSQKLGYHELSDAMMMTYVKMTPGQAKTCDVYGDFLMKKGNIAAAVEQYKMAYDLDDDYFLSLEKAEKLSAAFAEKNEQKKDE